MALRGGNPRRRSFAGPLLFASLLLTFERLARLRSYVQHSDDYLQLLAGPELASFFLLWAALQLTLIVLLLPAQKRRTIGESLRAPLPAATLAFLRVLVCLIWLLSIDGDRAAVLASIPANLRFSPEDPLNLLYSPDAASLAALLLQAAAVCAAFGICTAPALLLLGFCGGYLSLLLRSIGAPYTFDVLVFSTFLLAASPTGDFASVGSWVRGSAPSLTAARYAISINVFRLLVALGACIGTIRRFLDEGGGWLSQKVIAAEIQTSWFAQCLTPLTAGAVESPLLQILLGTKAFVSLILPLAVFSLRYRAIVGVFWILLQSSAAAFGEPVFPPLLLLSLAFIEWPAPRRRTARGAATAVSGKLDTVRRALEPVRKAADLVVSGASRLAIVWGLAAVCGTVWYLAPLGGFGRGRPLETFPSLLRDTTATVEVIGIARYLDDERVMDAPKSVLAGRLSCPLLFALEQNVVEEDDPQQLALRLAAFWYLLLESEQLDAESQVAQFYLDTHTVVPEHRNFNPVNRVLLLDFQSIPGIHTLRR